MPPAVGGAAGTGPLSFALTPAFGNTTGQLVAMRCLGSQAPGLCAYIGFVRPAESWALTAGGGGWTVAAAAVLGALLARFA